MVIEDITKWKAKIGKKTRNQRWKIEEGEEKNVEERKVNAY